MSMTKKKEPHKKTILICDNDQKITAPIKKELEKKGYAVMTAADTNQCLEKQEKGKIDLVLIDVMMPGRPVREIVAKMKETKVAYLTMVKISESERAEILRHNNIVDFIPKQIDINELVKRVQKITG
jgi:DNA-binding response OmpR family regulator